MPSWLLHRNLVAQKSWRTLIAKIITSGENSVNKIYIRTSKTIKPELNFQTRQERDVKKMYLVGEERKSFYVYPCHLFSWTILSHFKRLSYRKTKSSKSDSHVSQLSKSGRSLPVFLKDPKISISQMTSLPISHHPHSKLFS